MTARRAVGGVLATGTLLALLGLVPVVADAATRATTGGSADQSAPGARSTTPPPADSRPLVLLLVAGGMGTMGLLSREPEPGDRAARR